ncbi:MAG: hypothetical protein Kow001_07270 [Acidobacteriota bacterium]
MSPLKKENFSRGVPPGVGRRELVERLAEALTSPVPQTTERRVPGRTSFPGKATAVVRLRNENSVHRLD